MTQTQPQPIENMAGTMEDNQMFQTGIKKTKIEKYIMQYFTNGDIAKERKEENDMLKEDIGHLLGDSSEPLVFELPSGMFAVVQRKLGRKETLDKDVLAYLAKIEKDEFKHPLDYAMLLSQGKITTDMIKNSMVQQDTVTVSIRMVKNNPNKKRKQRK